MNADKIIATFPYESFTDRMLGSMASYTEKGRIEVNRDIFLSALRSGKYKKGCIKSDEKGIPIIETPEDEDGVCTCGIMFHLFPKPDGTENMLYSRNALGITRQDCDYIQQELNDTPLTFSEIADRIEKEVFKR